MADNSPAMFSPAPTSPQNRKVLYAIAGLLVLAVVVVLLIRKSGNGTATAESLKPIDAQAATLQIGNITMSEAGHGVGGTSLYVDGTLSNGSQRVLIGASVQVIFQTDDPNAAKLETLPVRLVRQKEPYVDLEPMSAEPIGPAQSHEFRLIFEDVPETWNQQPPQIRVVHTDWQ